jgi:hypothetical protein
MTILSLSDGAGFWRKKAVFQSLLMALCGGRFGCAAASPVEKLDRGAV